MLLRYNRYTLPAKERLIIDLQADISMTTDDKSATYMENRYNSEARFFCNDLVTQLCLNGAFVCLRDGAKKEKTKPTNH